MSKLIGKQEIDNAREGLKLALDTLRQNYIPGCAVVPKGTEIKNYVNTASMMVTSEDINIFTLGFYILNTIENIVSEKYTTSEILYLLDAENKLTKYLYSTRYEYLPVGIEVPDCYFLEVIHLMCSRIKDNLEIKVKQ